MKSYETFTEAYVDIVRDVYLNPEFVSSPRGMKVKESLGYQFRLKNPLHRIPYVNARDFSVHYMIAELLWYLSGNNETKWISNYSSFWDKISDDGRTANSSYGARIFRHHEYQGVQEDTWTQWQYVKNELKSDPDSRRAVIHIRMPQDSKFAKLDVPCTLSLQFLLRDDKLHMIVSMRSSDVILGIAYDVPAFTLMQELLAFELSKEMGRDVDLGDYIHLSSSLHIYERHFAMAEKIIDEGNGKDYKKFSQMPRMTSEPPISDLMSLEAEIRGSQCCDDLRSCYHRMIDSKSIKDQYWKDWATILASHRALKLGDKYRSDALLMDCDFFGYKFFKKE
jgi:thymidylate synthase